MHTLSDNTLRQRLKPDGTNFTGAAGTTNLTSDTIDTLGYGAFFVSVFFGAVVAGAATSVKLQHSDDDSTYADVAGSSQTVVDTADNTVFDWNVYRPLKRYWKVVTLRATQNSTVDAARVILYHPWNAAPTQGATVSGTKVLNSPASGTA